MFRISLISILLFLCSGHSFAAPSARKHISVVGSSTVYPFAAVIAEEYGRAAKFNNPNARSPIIESTGTGGGFKLFCSGVGYQYPDFSNASREMKQSEIEKCAQNGIHNVVEIKIGYDGIVLANEMSGYQYGLTKEQVFLALAEQVPNQKTGQLVANPYHQWSDIDASLPEIDIAVYGPPSTSGTRDAFVELVMEEPCMEMAAYIDTYPNKKSRARKCHTIRSDGKFIEAGENDNLIVQKLKNDKEALGIFGFSFLEENRGSIKAARINKVDPTFDNIVSGSYPVSRPLFMYFKKEHFKLVPQMRDFVKEIVSDDTIGSDGYLLQKGLIPLTDKEVEAIQAKVAVGS